MPKQGDAVCLAAGQSHPKLRARRRYTVTKVHSDGGIKLADAATGEKIDWGFTPSECCGLLAPAEEAEVMALHCALYLGREAGVVRAVLEAHGEVNECAGRGGKGQRGREGCERGEGVMVWGVRGEG